MTVFIGADNVHSFDVNDAICAHLRQVLQLKQFHSRTLRQFSVSEHIPIAYFKKRSLFFKLETHFEDF